MQRHHVLFVTMLAGLIVGCATPRAIERLADSHAGATFEATAIGCDETRRSEPKARQFRDLAAAIVWGKEVATIAPRRSCDVVIDALRDGNRQTIYRVSRDRRGVWSIGPADGSARQP